MTPGETVRMWQGVLAKNGRDDIGYIDLKGSIWGQRIIFDPPPVMMPLSLGELALAEYGDALLANASGRPSERRVKFAYPRPITVQFDCCDATALCRAMWHRRAA